MFRKILVANRGEIAIRVIRACKELGIKCVSIYSDADKNALHVRFADEAYHIGPSNPLESYLNIERIIDVAIKAGVDAIHPGYGFLSENSIFARECEKNGIVFIGPNPRAIELAGDKLKAKQMAKKAGLPVIPGPLEPVTDIERAVRAAERIGYPVIIKPADGGGGIGMKIAHNEEQLRSLFDISQQEAMNAFGSDRVIVEKVIQGAKHIEMQIVMDKNGDGVWLGERDCSIQRRHQKLIEETPSPVISKEEREKIGELALKFSEAIEYDNVGTVEFLYRNGEIYFLEMNTRLQVEHGITELVTGIDLVKEQIKIAKGSALGYTQRDVEIRGWAIEARILAEDPANGFVPSPGKVTFYKEPGGIGVRVDSYIYEGYEIPPYYDSLVAKLIVWGANRFEAIHRLERGISEFMIGGVKTNIPLIRKIINEEEFLVGNYTTEFLNSKLDKLTRELRLEEQKMIAALAVVLAMNKDSLTSGSLKRVLKMPKALYHHNAEISISKRMLQYVKWGKNISRWRRVSFNQF